jgi:hypothetical protein
MQTYILILIGILVLLLIGVVYFGWRKIINLEIESNKNKYDIEALRGLLSKLLDGDEIEMNPSFFKKERPYNIQMNVNELKNKQFGGADESEVETLHSSDDEEEIPEDESTVSIENIEDEDSDSDEDDSDEEEEEDSEDEDEDDSEDDEDEDDSEDESEEEETENSEKDEKPESKEEEVKVNEPEQEVKEINLEKKEDKQEEQEEESKTEVKVVEVANKNVKKFPSESLKNYKSGDIVVSKNDGNKYKVVMYKNQKKWKLIEE